MNSRRDEHQIQNLVVGKLAKRLGSMFRRLMRGRVNRNVDENIQTGIDIDDKVIGGGDLRAM